MIKKRTIFSETIICVFIVISLVSTSQCNSSKPLSSASKDSMDKLKSLPYLTWTPAKDTSRSGVIRYNTKRSYPGLNIYCSRNLPEAYLMNMSGKILHKWSYGSYAWQHIELCNNGDLLVIVKDRMLMRLDINSKLIWKKKLFVHHDVSIANNQDIYVLARKDETDFYNGSAMRFLNDYIIILSPEGIIRKEFSLYSVLKQELNLEETYRKIKKWTDNPLNLVSMVENKMSKGFYIKNCTPLDIFHTNSIEIINMEIPNLCKKGDLLISVRELNLIAILDIEREKIIWKWGTQDLCRPHHPTLIENGNILIFDNGIDKKRSRIIELNPQSKTIVKEYKKENFFSERRGSNQRLPNGNTLITESDRGHVFEITEDNKIVWEFFNPQVKVEEKKRAAIYRMMRIVDLNHFPEIKEIAHI